MAAIARNPSSMKRNRKSMRLLTSLKSWRTMPTVRSSSPHQTCHKTTSILELEAWIKANREYKDWIPTIQQANSWLLIKITLKCSRRKQHMQEAITARRPHSSTTAWRKTRTCFSLKTASTIHQMGRTFMQNHMKVKGWKCLAMMQDLSLLSHTASPIRQPELLFISTRSLQWKMTKN